LPTALLPDADHGEAPISGSARGETRRDPDAMISKFPPIEEIHVMVGRRNGRPFLCGDPRMARHQEWVAPVMRAVQ
jgi:hypothetical protein